MLEISDKTNLLEQKSYKYSLQDVADPNLYRDVYPYTQVPRVAFNHRRVPIGMPKDIWITDTSFRDGQQSMEPYTVDQIVGCMMNVRRYGWKGGASMSLVMTPDCKVYDISGIGELGAETELRKGDVVESQTNLFGQIEAVFVTSRQ